MNKFNLKTIDSWDKKVISRLNGKGGKGVTIILRIISFFGRETFWFLFIAYFFFIWYAPTIYVYSSTTFIIGVLTIAPIKKYVNRPRPFESMETIRVLESKPISRSMPSWHSYNVVSQGLLIGYLGHSYMVMILFLIFALAVSYSRIQLGVHYPTDVIIGYIIGLCGFIATILLLGPFFLEIVRFFEQFIPYEIPYHRINPLLFTNITYLMLCISIFVFIILFGFRKTLSRFIKKEKQFRKGTLAKS